MAGPALRILGIDPGLRVTGFGIIGKNGATLAHIASGCIKSALLGPGYSDKEGRLAVKHLPEGLSISDGIRQVLWSLSKS